MDIRLLKYFLAVAAEGNITAAAEVLHITQPTLSKQLMMLEDELETKLFLRGHKQITLTEDGLLLQKRALEIVNLEEQTRAEILHRTHAVSGDVFLSAAEMASLDRLSHVIRNVHEQYPEIRFHLIYSDASGSIQNLDRGIVDFALLCGQYDERHHNGLTFPDLDQWGMILSEAHPLSRAQAIRPSDLRKLPLLLTRQTADSTSLSSWLGGSLQQLNIIGTFDLAHIALPLVRQNLCACMVLDRKNNPWGEGLRFVPFDPPILLRNHLIWKRNQRLSDAAAIFLDAVKTELNAKPEAD